MANNFYQYQVPFTDTTYHSCKVDSEEFKKDLVRFAGTCRVVNGLKTARIGAIGARPNDLFPNLQKLMKHMVKNGFEHHVGMVRSHVGDIVQEAIETYLGWDLYGHE